MNQKSIKNQQSIRLQPDGIVQTPELTCCHPGLAAHVAALDHKGLDCPVLALSTVSYPLMRPWLPGGALIEHFCPTPAGHLYCAQHV